MGIDRQRIVDNFYPEGSEVASHFTPCSIPNGCQGEAWYDFDPEAARALLAEAGFPDGFETSIFYRDVFRGYLPEPGLVAVEFQTQLKENLGIDAEVVVMESGEFIDESTNGRLDGFYLLGWGADFPHITNFLDFHFSAANPQFGDPFPEIYEVLEEASQIGDPAESAELYVAGQQRAQGPGPDAADRTRRFLLSRTGYRRQRSLPAVRRAAVQLCRSWHGHVRLYAERRADQPVLLR